MTPISSDLAVTARTAVPRAGNEASVQHSLEDHVRIQSPMSVDPSGRFIRAAGPEAGPGTVVGKFSKVCPVAREADCSLRAAAKGPNYPSDGPKVSLTDCEVEVFRFLAHGQRISVREHMTGALWHGWVDTTFPGHGFVWCISDIGERKLLDIRVHTVWWSGEHAPAGASGSRPRRLELAGSMLATSVSEQHPSFQSGSCSFWDETDPPASARR